MEQPQPQQVERALAMPTLATLTGRPRLDIDFTDITYAVGARGQKTILHGVTGRFRSGQLTAIMGSSGAGKSSLMDILTGNRLRGVTGSVLVNGKPRDLASFRRLSCYVMQEDLLQPHLTLVEAMVVAARLKLGKQLTEFQKKAVVDEVLNVLGLSECRDTFTDKLSGGQRKRFSIAQELVSNPSVIFLDEPTTGLDQLACSQCLRVLKMLARDGCNVICSIHQPSASIFKQFDAVYLMTRGRCAYQGTALQLVPFLASLEFHCPTTYNPADYVIEILHECTDETANTISSAVQNGKCFIQEPSDKKLDSFIAHRLCIPWETDAGGIKTLKYTTTPFCNQFWILFQRMILQYVRNKSLLLTMLATYLTTGLTTGMVFLHSGNRGDSALVHLNFMATSLVMACCCQILPPAILYPFELKLVKREYQNGWYSLNSYFAAVFISKLICMHAWTLVFVPLSYLLSSQPLEWYRFLMYSLLFFLVSIISESYGLLIGTVFRPQIGAVIGPCVISPVVALWQYNLGVYHKISLFMKIVTNMSFIRLGMIGMIIAMMRDRKPMDCDVMFCPFQYPHVILRMLNAEEESITVQILGLFGMFVVLRVIWYLVIRLRLSSDFYNIWINYAYKIFR
ncbi:ATP-binding cassette sub-family G member 1-like [Schistocerca americana]|uniref:ATP-binding cassette sub-family G member 1-like n=1 Tax=Schistocerca americana TaxID=7009 RepID=UPI001F4F86AD|nr:ATP-binding cassette sub-family G member 1-like [Schistocerca americana]